MDKQILNFTVNEQILVCENPIKISTNKVNYIQAHFDLGTNWSGFDSVRAVWFNDFNCISTVLDSLGNCVVPFEVMKRKGNVKVNLVGSISEDDVLTDRLTSYPVVAVIVDCTAQITGANTSPITPSEYEQFVAAVHEDAERAEQGASNAETSAQNASDSATSASTSASNASISENNAKVSERNAEVYKNQAHEEAQDASESATSAQNYAEDAEDARDTILGMRATANTLSEGSDATASYSNGLLTLGIPRGNTGAKGDKGDRGDVGATPNLSIGTVTTLEPNESATATIGGTAENPILSLGIPKGDTGEVSLSELEQTTVVQTLSDTEPYNYRRTNNGNGSGTREYDEIVGASVGWNQLVPTIRKSGTTIPNGTATFSYYVVDESRAIPNHVYLASVDITYNGSKFPMRTYAQFGNKYGTPVIDITSNAKKKCEWIVKAENTNVLQFGISNITTSDKLTSADKWSRDNAMCVDLTLFNSAIADYVYSLEQSTAGSGVAWLKSHFPKLFDNGYQPFDSGSIKSVSGLVSHEMVGENLWDEEWEVYGSSQIKSKNLIPLIPNTTYYLKAPAGIGATLYFKEDTDIPSSSSWSRVNETFTVPSNIHYAILYAGSGYGTTYNNDICINLSDPSINGQYFPYEKHTYPLDSSVTLRGQYKLDANNQLYADGDVWKSDGEITRKYGTRAYQSGDESDATVVTDGTTTVYPLTTPTTETATPYTSPQWCDSNGTEEYVGSELPVGHNTDYPMSLIDTADGLSNGTYEPRITVANGKKTVTWVSV